MFALTASLVYRLYSQPCDMRKSFNGLSGLVRDGLERDPLSGEVFIFLNKCRKLIKLLHWEKGGFVVYCKRLEQGTFTRPVLKVDQQSISWPELVLMIEGIVVKKSIQKVRYQVG